MRIAICINYLAVGGSQTFALAFADALGKGGHDVYVYDFNLPHFSKSLKDLNSPLLDSSHFVFKQFNIRVLPALYKNIIRISATRSLITWAVNKLRVQDFRKFINHNNIEVVSSHLMAADTLASLAIQNLQQTIHCITMHGSYEGFPSVLTKKIREVVFSRVDGIVYLTKNNIAFLNKLKRVNKSVKTTQIYNGYSPQLFDLEDHGVCRKDINISEDAFIFIQVARGAMDKGWQELINAFLRLKRNTNRKIILLLVGQSEYILGLKEKYKNEKEIIFYGESGNPIALIKMSDVGILASYYKGESLPNTVIEYMFLNKPVIASNIGEIRAMLETSTANPAGYVVDLSPQGTIDEVGLLEKMICYLNNHTIYMEHARNSIICSEKFAMNNCIGAYIRLFNHLVKEKKHSYYGI